MEGVSHTVSSDRFVAEAEGPGADPLGKDLKDRDGVLDPGEKGVGVPQGADKRCPKLVPDAVLVPGAFGGDGGGGGRLSKAEVSFKGRSGGKVRNCQGFVCGNCWA